MTSICSQWSQSIAKQVDISVECQKPVCRQYRLHSEQVKFVGCWGPVQRGPRPGPAWCVTPVKRETDTTEKIPSPLRWRAVTTK